MKETSKQIKKELKEIYNADKIPKSQLKYVNKLIEMSNQILKIKIFGILDKMPVITYYRPVLGNKKVPLINKDELRKQIKEMK